MGERLHAMNFVEGQTVGVDFGHAELFGDVLSCGLRITREHHGVSNPHAAQPRNGVGGIGANLIAQNDGAGILAVHGNVDADLTRLEFLLRRPRVDIADESTFSDHDEPAAHTGREAVSRGLHDVGGGCDIEA
jgi:hypothetical protein